MDKLKESLVTHIQDTSAVLTYHQDVMRTMKT